MGIWDWFRPSKPDLSPAVPFYLPSWDMETVLDSKDTNEWIEGLNRLRKMDKDFRVFGSECHKYRLEPVLSEEELVAFECKHGVRLPEDYRNFLATVGNGGAGPYYGLDPLKRTPSDLSRPFPVKTPSNDAKSWALEPLSDPGQYPGVLEFCHLGCGGYAYLVVNGRTYGTIWYGREEFYATGLSFSGWYREWLESKIRLLENEPLALRIRVGMSTQDVLSLTGTIWEARDSMDPQLRYFESSEIPAQLKIDRQNRVVDINLDVLY